MFCPQGCGHTHGPAEPGSLSSVLDGVGPRARGVASLSGGPASCPAPGPGHTACHSAGPPLSWAFQGTVLVTPPWLPPVERLSSPPRHATGPPSGTATGREVQPSGTSVRRGVSSPGSAHLVNYLIHLN